MTYPDPRLPEEELSTIDMVLVVVLTLFFVIVFISGLFTLAGTVSSFMIHNI